MDETRETTSKAEGLTTKYFDQDFNFEEWAEECALRYQLPEIGHRSSEKVELSQDWEEFYRIHDNGQFFKSRKYLAKEFEPWLQRSRLLLEVGCGYGCSIFPLMESFPQMNFIATDYSHIALAILQQNRKYDPSRVLVQPWDATLPFPLPDIPHIDTALMIFALSAIHPSNHLTALSNLYQAVSEGSYLLFRDYGIHDMTMYRHTIRHSEYLFERSDGTLSYYFDIDNFVTLAKAASFSVIEIKYATVINRNRKSGVEMRRVFLHAVLQKDCVGCEGKEVGHNV